MTDPTIQKTWEFALNGIAFQNSAQGGTTAHQDRREMMLDIKQILTNTGSHAGMTTPWTVTASSNGTLSTGDNWNSIADLKWRDEDSPGTTFGWIVLRQTGISTTFELLIALESDSVNDDGAQIYASVAQAGYSGGNTTTAPTATDERVLRNDDATNLGFWGSGVDGGSYTYRWHVMMSSDGECSRVAIFINTVQTGFWMFDVPDNPASGWTDPYLATILGTFDTATNMMTFTQFNVAANMKGRYSGADTTMFLSTEGYANVASPGRNQLDNTWSLSEMGIYSKTSTFTGRMGSVYDLWWGVFGPSGRFFPQAGTRLYASMASMVVPWDGSTVMGVK